MGKKTLGTPFLFPFCLDEGTLRATLFVACWESSEDSSDDLSDNVSDKAKRYIQLGALGRAGRAVQGAAGGQALVPDPGSNAGRGAVAQVGAGSEECRFE